MSHYARIVKELPSWTVTTHERVDLGVDTQIRNVKLGDGSYTFEARVVLPSATLGAWLRLETFEDLPAFTDKGTAQRARRNHSTLRRGRPLTGDEHVARPIAFRPTRAQAEWVHKRAAKLKMTVSDYVRRTLSADGMPN